MYKRIENPSQLPDDEYLTPEQVTELYPASAPIMHRRGACG